MRRRSWGATPLEQRRRDLCLHLLPLVAVLRTRECDRATICRVGPPAFRSKGKCFSRNVSDWIRGGGTGIAAFGYARRSRWNVRDWALAQAKTRGRACLYYFVHEPSTLVEAAELACGTRRPNHVRIRYSKSGVDGGRSCARRCDVVLLGELCEERQSKRTRASCVAGHSNGSTRPDDDPGAEGRGGADARLWAGDLVRLGCDTSLGRAGEVRNRIVACGIPGLLEYKRVLLLRPRHHSFTAKIKKSLPTNQLLTRKIAAEAQIRLIPSGLGGIYAIDLAN